MPDRHFILGTAGHVDHGKTKLVGCLSGWDTDRLKEEKERGISIELGFAPLWLDDGTMIGIVDVPGHERFVKNMVAGAGGIDVAMLVVAADEGVMPQTREHLEVLRSLALSHGLVVITKIDLLAKDMAAILKDDIADLVEGTFLEEAPIVETSVVTGAGIDDLKRILKRVCEAIPERDKGGSFRLAVDRVFHKQGIGVVVTGSCYSGTVSIGDTLNLLPSQKSVRVRDIQCFGEKRQQGFAGERLAIALQGGRLNEVSRGDMLVTPSKFAASYILDGTIELARYARFELKQRERVRLHHGAREVLGRVSLLEKDKMQSGERGLAQVRLESPIVADEGDYFVLRKYSPSRVIGGGCVLDPRARKHRPFDGEVIESLRIMQSGDPQDRIMRELRDMGLTGVPTRQIDAAARERLMEQGRILAIDKIVFHADSLSCLGHQVHELARAYNKAHPLRYGLDKEELRQRLKFPHSTSTFNKVLEHIAVSSSIYIRNNLVRADTESIELPEDLAERLETLETMIREAGVLLKREADMSRQWVRPSDLLDSLRLLRDERRIHRIGEDSYIHSDVLASCIGRLRRWFAKSPQISVPEFKDLFGITRRQAIPLLEFLDSRRLTARQENVRVAGSKLRDPS